jgi:phenylacetate-CoA ligase
MLPALARSLLLPLHESILGRSTFSILHWLKSNEGEHPERLLQLQADKLNRLLEHAMQAIPYWRDRLAGRLSSPRPGQPASPLAAVPVLTRAEIRRHREAMRWADAPGKVLLHKSGGTTDDNLLFYWGRARQSWDRAMRIRGLARFGILPGDRTLHLWPCYAPQGWTDQFKDRLRTLRDWLTNDVVLDPRPFSPERADAVLSRFQAYRPALIIAYPSWLMVLGEHVRAANRPLRLPDLRRILCTGEVLFAFQRRSIEETFGVPVLQEYGSQDSGLIAHEEPGGKLLLNAEQMIVEILRDGEPARPGELGEVVISHFHTEVMPFIRYATGDTARQPAQPWPSPGVQGLPVFPIPEGRTSDLLATADGTLCPLRPVVEALVEQTGFWHFNLHQTAPDKMLVSEASGGRKPPEDRRGRMEEVLRSFLGKSLQIEWRSGFRFKPLRSGKKRFACSPVAMRLIAHDRESGMSLARAWPQALNDD